MQEGTLGGEARATRYEVRSASVRTRVKDLVTWAAPRTLLPIECQGSLPARIMPNAGQRPAFPMAREMLIALYHCLFVALPLTYRHPFSAFRER